VLSLIATLLAIASVAIPIAIVVAIVRRVARVSERLRDPTRLQRAFAESAAAALRRAGADPKAVAKLEVLRPEPTVDRVADRNAVAYEARIGLQRKGGYAMQPRPPVAVAPEPPSLIEDEPRPRLQPLRRAPRPRAQPTPSPSLGLDLGDSFRLDEPPEINEPRGAFAVSNWFAFALFASAAAYCFLR